MKSREDKKGKGIEGKKRMGMNQMQMVVVGVGEAFSS